MKKMFFLIFLAFFGFGCKDLAENLTSPTIMQEKFSVSQGANKITTCSQAEEILGELKRFYTNGGWPKGLEELIQEFASSDYPQWRELQVQDVNCWELIRSGKCEEALKIAQEISDQVHAIVERAEKEWNKAAAQYNIDTAKFQKKTIEDLWMRCASDKCSSVDEWMKTFPEVNAYYRWSGAAGNLTMAQDAFKKGEYQGAKTWASWAIESFGWVLGYLSQQNI
jgi:hypothetical protein